MAIADMAKDLRENTGYPWQLCILAASRVPDYHMAVEMLPAIHRELAGMPTEQ